MGDMIIMEGQVRSGQVIRSWLGQVGPCWLIG